MEEIDVPARAVDDDGAHPASVVYGCFIVFTAATQSSVCPVVWIT
jgi:hypothetical protein